MATTLAALEAVKSQVRLEERMHEETTRPVTRFEWETESPWGRLGVSVSIPRPSATATEAEVDAWRRWRRSVIEEECRVHPPINASSAGGGR